MVSPLEGSRRTQLYGLQSSLKMLLEKISEIYLQGRLKAKAQTACLELGPLSNSKSTRPRSPPPPPSLPESLGRLYGRTSVALDILYQTASCSLFSGLTEAYIFPKRCSEMQNLLEVVTTNESFALNTRGALKLRRFSSPDLSSLKCSAFLRPTPKRAAAP